MACYFERLWHPDPLYVGPGDSAVKTLYRPPDVACFALAGITCDGTIPEKKNRDRVRNDVDSDRGAALLELSLLTSSKVQSSPW